MAKLLSAAETPESWASGGQAIEISEEISAFPRLGEALVQELERVDPAEHPANWQHTAVNGRVSFGFADAQSSDVIVTVELTTEVPLVCQRCLEAFRESLDVDTSLHLVKDSGSPGRDDYEAWELDEDLVRPIDLVDELMVMALPFAAMHDNGECSAGVPDDTPAAEDTTRPFADLKALMEAASKPDEPAKD